MSDQPFNLVLEMLQAIRADIAEVRETLREHGHRLSRLEIAMASLRRDQAQDAEQTAHLEVRIDRVNERRERVERRLDLRDS